MSDHWMPTIDLPLTEEQFRQLPRHPAYCYEYLGGKACLSPHSMHYHCMLDLQSEEVPADVSLRPVRPSDWAELVPVFAGAFRDIQPYGSLDDATLLTAADEALTRTRTGGDGPWIERASLVAVDLGNLQGAIFITLLPELDPCDADSYRWDDPPPPDAVDQCLGRPHLTWIFAAPGKAGQGIGSALLAGAARQLLAMGYRELLSTFVIGNCSSMLWHWRSGFRLLAHPSSRRLYKQRQREAAK
jgi:GNAT superfamily N-acetyltransferase